MEPLEIGEARIDHVLFTHTLTLETKKGVTVLNSECFSAIQYNYVPEAFVVTTSSNATMNCVR